ncbi:hypothetical protein E4188_23850 (plasmid) [Aeromonas media]|nr:MULTISPECIES: hypothetical protein [Aeromonas]QJT41526.1 hypothetical protein E4188_23850 [Aeromonas media]HDN9429586.1 hypothetical protein [Aeromonas salmonicida]
MKPNVNNAISRNQLAIVAIASLFCGKAFSGVDEVWASSPATYDTLWAQAYAAAVNPSFSGSGGRVDLYSGSSTAVNISVPTTVNVLYVSFDLDGRGITQLMFDLQDAVSRGDVRIYNRGGENADRPYDALIRVSRSGGVVTLRGEGVWTGAPVLKRVVGFSL